MKTSFFFIAATAIFLMACPQKQLNAQTQGAPNYSSPGVGGIVTPGTGPESARPGMAPIVRATPSPTGTPGFSPGSMGSGGNPGTSNTWPSPVPTGTPGLR